MVIASVFSGCSVATVFVLFNNTEKTVRVYNGAKWLVLQPKKSQTFSGGISQEITFIIDAGVGAKGYNIFETRIPGKLVSSENRHPSLYLQLESSGAIYVTTPKPNFPVLEFPDQPHGFPLVPKNGKFEKSGWTSQPG